MDTAKEKGEMWRRIHFDEMKRARKKKIIQRGDVVVVARDCGCGRAVQGEWLNDYLPAVGTAYFNMNA